MKFFLPVNGRCDSCRNGIRSPLPMLPEQSQDDRQNAPSPPKKRPWQFWFHSLYLLTPVVDPTPHRRRQKGAFCAA